MAAEARKQPLGCSWCYWETAASHPCQPRWVINNGPRHSALVQSYLHNIPLEVLKWSLKSHSLGFSCYYKVAWMSQYYRHLGLPVAVFCQHTAAEFRTTVSQQRREKNAGATEWNARCYHYLPLDGQGPLSHYQSITTACSKGQLAIGRDPLRAGNP